MSLRLSQLIMEQGELPHYETVTMFFSASYNEPHEESLAVSGAVDFYKAPGLYWTVPAFLRRNVLPLAEFAIQQLSYQPG